MKERISVTEAAQMLSMTPQLLRLSMQRGQLPIGMVLGEGKRLTYVIYREKVEKFIEGENT